MTTTKVPFLNLGRIHSELKQDILRRLDSIIDRSAFVLGPEVEEFEKSFAKYCGTEFALGVSSGIDAIALALRALGIGPGDEVITQANTFISTVYAISLVGAKPILVDAEQSSWNLDPKQLEKVVTSKTKAIIPVHLYGQPASMEPILKFAKDHRLFVVEDVAQAHGATYNGKKCGSFGHISCFSFYPSKNLGAMGEGGAVVTSDKDLYQKAKIIRDVGQKKKYDHVEIASNYRLHTFQAAVLSAKLPHLDKHNKDRQEVAKKFDAAFSKISGLKIQPALSDRTHVYHLYIVATDSNSSRDKLKDFLNERGVQTGIHYPVPPHLQVCYQNLGYRKGCFPLTEELAERILSLPMFPEMQPGEVDAVISNVKEFFNAR